MNDKDRLLAEQLQLIKSLITEVEKNVVHEKITGEKIKPKKDEMDTIIKIILYEEAMNGNLAEAWLNWGN